MKKIICFLLTFIIIISVFPATMITALADDTVFDGGDGTETFPYLISTAEQLNQIGNFPASYFLQTTDIDMTSSYYYTVNSFSGGYDGGGHTISGLRNCIFNENTGFVRNLGLINANIQNASSKSEGNHKRMTYSAVIAITNSGSISGCYSIDASVEARTNFSATDATAESFAGGLVETNTESGTIENCYTRGTVRASSDARATGVVNTFASAKSYAGGIAARSSGTIKNCYSTADVNAAAYRSGYTGSAAAYKGIICGSNTGTGAIENSYYTESLTCSTGTGFNSGNEPEKVENSELQDYSMISKLDPTRSYIWKMDIYNLNESYPILNTQANDTMNISLSHQPGNHKKEFQLTIAPKFNWYKLYYCVVGKSDGFNPCTEPIAITDKDTMVIVYLENDYIPSMRKAFKLNYHLADYPVSASVESGTYHELISVKLTSDETGAEIYYTTDGSDPRQGSGTRYMRAIPIYKNTIISAVAKVNGEFGDLLNYEYRISPVITPNIPAGSYNQPFQLSLTSSLKPYEIYYTTNGGDPTKENQGAIKYSGEFEIYSTTEIKTAACYEGEWSEIQSFQYEFPRAEIIPSIPAGEYEDVVKDLDFSCNLPYLDLDVMISGEFGNKTTPIDIYKTGSVDVTAKYKGQYVTSKRFTYTLPKAEITSNYSSGDYNDIINIELQCNIPSYDLFYTTNGKNPAVNGILYTKPIELDDTTNLRVAAKYGDAFIAEKSFDYSLDLEYVTANLRGGHYTDKIDVTLTTSNPFYDIYYTTDGSSPKTNGIKYDGPIEIKQSTVITAVPVFGDIFGKTSLFKYTIGSQPPTPLEGISADNYMIRKERDGYYTIFFDVSSTLPHPKSADIYIAIYDRNGRVQEAKKYRDEFSAGLDSTVSLPYSTKLQLQSDNYFKIMCWQSGTMYPIFENGRVTASDIK